MLVIGSTRRIAFIKEFCELQFCVLRNRSHVQNFRSSDAVVVVEIKSYYTMILFAVFISVAVMSVDVKTECTRALCVLARSFVF